MMREESNQTLAIILAAGKGTRMNSATPKVLHPVAGLPMLGHVMQAAKAAGCRQLCVVGSPDAPEVANFARHLMADVLLAEQAEQRGTAHAVLAARPQVPPSHGNVVVLFGDSPLIQPATIETMLRTLSKDPKLGAVLCGFELEDGGAYGRLIRDADGQLQEVVEAKDATPGQLAERWCNAGVMALRGSIVWDVLEQIGSDNAQGEYYLPDAVVMARRLGYRCAVQPCAPQEALGVNDRAQLADVEQRMQERLRAAAMCEGATLQDPQTTYFSYDTKLGQDVVIQPNVWFGTDVVVGDRVEIRAFSHLEGCVIGDDAMVGPFARIRPGSNVGAQCKVGNFVELKKVTLEAGAKVSHLSYLGDAHVGEETNIGAGTITCNYDGYKKYHTEIGREVFIGSNSALVAPVVVGHGAYVGAGSVVTEDVAPDSLAVARSRQAHKQDWANAFRARMKKQK